MARVKMINSARDIETVQNRKFTSTAATFWTMKSAAISARARIGYKRISHLALLEAAILPDGAAAVEYASARGDALKTQDWLEL